jgi:hypothetical protein
MGNYGSLADEQVSYKITLFFKFGTKGIVKLDGRRH